MDLDFISLNIAKNSQNTFRSDFMDITTNPNMLDKFGNNILQAVADMAESPLNLAVVQHIITTPGFNVNHKDAEGRLCLFHACASAKVWQMLIEQGAEIDVKCSKGKSVLYWHLRYGQDVEKVKVMVRGGIDLTQVDWETFRGI